MVPPASSVSQENPLLSYAERAKKGRNNASPSNLAQTHPRSTLVSPPISNSSSATSNNTNSAYGTNPRTQTTSTEETSNGTPPSALHTDSDDTTNRTVTHTSGVGLPPQVLPPRENAQKAGSVPVNFWDYRKGQTAQTRASSHSSPGSQSNRGTDTLHPSEAPAVAFPQTLTPSASNGHTKTASPSQRQDANGYSNDQSQNLTSPQRSNSIPPSVHDTASWPTVGMSVHTQNRLPNENNSMLDGRGLKSDDHKGRDNGKLQADSALRKGEKPKWVPIPPEELQAAADAHRNRTGRPHGGHSRSRSQHQHNKASKSTPGSTPGQTSQGQSRTHSASGIRQSRSQTGSASHSQAQSSTGSAHSSPRQPPSRGSRRLPEDSGTSRLSADPVNLKIRSIRSSRAASPPGARSLQNEILTPENGHPPPPNSGHQLAGTIEQPQFHTESAQLHGENFYPVPLPVSSANSQARSYHSPQASNSPAANTYGLPPMPQPMYPPPSLPPPHGGYGVPTYTTYLPYDFPPYSHPPPYMHWPTQGHSPGLYPPIPDHHSRSPSNHSSFTPLPGASTTRDSRHQDDLPPLAMNEQPLPPARSDPGALSSFAHQHYSSNASQGDTSARPKEFTFGSIQAANKQSPTPPQPTPNVTQSGTNQNASVGTNGGQVTAPEDVPSLQQGLTALSIGLHPGEAGPFRTRSRAHAKSVGKQKETAPVRWKPSHEAVGDVGVTKVIDLTDAATPRWEFGTSGKAATEQGPGTSEHSAQELLSGPPSPRLLPVPQLDKGAGTAPPIGDLPALVFQPPPSLPPVEIPPLPAGLPDGLPPLNPLAPPVSYPYPNVPLASPHAEHRNPEEWENKNYSWGLGRGSNDVSSAKGDRERDHTRDYNPGRPRRGSYGGYGYERSGYNARRGRGGGSFGGRGYGGRPGPSRGGYQQSHSPRSPFHVAQQQPIGAPFPEPGYYTSPPPQVPQGTTYFHPLGYNFPPYPPYPPLPAPTPVMPPPPAPPVPTPQSLPPFPLDHTRYFLLGQLEYYLSAQNLAQDLYLRQQMDSRGWIPISLIASFNRVKQLTADFQLVRDVLALSSLVEVKDEWVRVRSWPTYVLPTASLSRVEEFTYESYAYPEFEEREPLARDGAEQDSTLHDEDEASEEDVVFVMEKQDQAIWAPGHLSATHQQHSNTSA